MNQNHNFQNRSFQDLMETITANMPSLTFFGIILTYGITAALNVHFLPLPAFYSIPAALAIQFGRFAVVFTDFLNNQTGYLSVVLVCWVPKWKGGWLGVALNVSVAYRSDSQNVHLGVLLGQATQHATQHLKPAQRLERYRVMGNHVHGSNFASFGR